MHRGALALVAVVLLAGCAGLAPGEASFDTAAPGADDGVAHEERQPPDEDVLGFHDGYWHDDPVTVNATGGLNETEREAVTARSIARVEYIRGLEFDEDVNVTVINRTQFTGQQQNWTAANDQEAFEDAKFAALFIVGTGESATSSQQETTNNIVRGFYSPTTKDIVIISDSETPRVDTSILIHELTHAAQDQRFDLEATTAQHPHDLHQARLGLIEGDANLVQQQYESRCGAEWSCVEYAGGGESDSQPSEPHWGLYFTSFFPYSDGPAFTDSLRDGDDWSAVNDAYEKPPNSTVEIMDPDRYGQFEPDAVALSDTGEWDRVRRDGAPDYDVLGPSALAASFAYTLYDDSNTDALVAPNDFLNFDGGEVNKTNPLNYDLAQTRGWQGDRLHVYERNGEVAYVWRLAWESPDAADRFTSDYHDLLGYWGGQRVDGNVWKVDDESPFTGAYRVVTTDDTVTITYAPSRAELDAVRASTDRPTTVTAAEGRVPSGNATAGSTERMVSAGG